MYSFPSHSRFGLRALKAWTPIAQMLAVTGVLLGASSVASAAPVVPIAGLCEIATPANGGIGKYATLLNDRVARCIDDCGHGSDCDVLTIPAEGLPFWVEKPAGPVSGIYDRFGVRQTGASAQYALGATVVDTELACETAAKALSASRGNEPFFCVTFSVKMGCPNGAATCVRATQFEILPKIKQFMDKSTGAHALLGDRAPAAMGIVTGVQIYASRDSDFACEKQPIDPATVAMYNPVVLRQIAFGFKSNGEPLCRIDYADLCAQAMGLAFEDAAAGCKGKPPGSMITAADIPSLAGCTQAGAAPEVKCPGCTPLPAQTCDALKTQYFADQTFKDGCGKVCTVAGTKVPPPPAPNPSQTPGPSPSSGPLPSSSTCGVGIPKTGFDCGALAGNVCMDTDFFDGCGITCGKVGARACGGSPINTSCPAGEEFSPISQNCVACESGFFKPMSGSSNCTPCGNPPMGTYGSQPADRKSCGVVSCNVGYVKSADGRCEQDCPTVIALLSSGGKNNTAGPFNLPIDSANACMGNHTAKCSNECTGRTRGCVPYDGSPIQYHYSWPTTGLLPCEIGGG